MASLTTLREAEASALGGLSFAAIPSKLQTGTPVTTVELKLKQASAVLGVSAKELQNLVQLKVIRPPRRDNFHWFDRRLLLEALVPSI